MEEGNGVAELYRKYRPTKFKEIIGQRDAIKVLTNFINSDQIPHAILLTGSSGVGKTTIARIMRDKLECHGRGDYTEINFASNRGIDTVREIQQRMGFPSMKGGSRLWYFDEVHAGTKESFSALLKTLEDPPKHAYFILATNEPQKLPRTLRGRCTEIKLRALTEEELTEVVTGVLEKEGKTLDREVLERIVSVAHGSAREALVALGQVIDLKSKEQQLAVIAPPKIETDAFSIVKALVWGRGDWKEVCSILNSIDEGSEWEGLRRQVVICAAKEILKGGKGAEKAALLIEQFESAPYDENKYGRAIFVKNCYMLLGNR